MTAQTHPEEPRSFELAETHVARTPAPEPGGTDPVAPGGDPFAETAAATATEPAAKGEPEPADADIPPPARTAAPETIGELATAAAAEASADDDRTPPRRGIAPSPRKVVLASLASLGLCAAAVLATEGFQDQPPRSGTAQALTLGVPAAGHAAPAAADAPLAPAEPTRLRIAAIALDTPLSGDDKAAADQPTWFRAAANPGTVGTAVVAGPAGTRHDPAVFHKLGGLKKSDTVAVDRADGTTAVFTVDTVHSGRNPKVCDTHSVTAGPAATRPQLEIVACGTAYDERHHRYRKNVVVSAHLTGSEQTGKR